MRAVTDFCSPPGSWDGDGGEVAVGNVRQEVIVMKVRESSGRRPRYRRLWCPLVGREVEVAFEERRALCFRHPVGVTTCSVFEPPNLPACDQRCVDSTFRRRWWPVLPIGLT